MDAGLKTEHDRTKFTKNRAAIPPDKFSKCPFQIIGTAFTSEYILLTLYQADLRELKK